MQIEGPEREDEMIPATPPKSATITSNNGGKVLASISAVGFCKWRNRKA
jgi:hypothetical protein